MPQVELTDEVEVLVEVEVTQVVVLAHLVKEILAALEELTLVVEEAAENQEVVLRTLGTREVTEEMERHHLYQVLQ